jgi:hypothetical protein
LHQTQPRWLFQSECHHSVFNSVLIDRLDINKALMWQLNLLSQVIPALGAVIWEFSEQDQLDPRLRRDAVNFYADLVRTGGAVARSHGEWAAGICDEELNELLRALESRCSNKWKLPWANIAIFRKVRLLLSHGVNRPSPQSL